MFGFTNGFMNFITYFRLLCNFNDCLLNPGLCLSTGNALFKINYQGHYNCTCKCCRQLGTRATQCWTAMPNVSL
jgi:hypothetical protein